MRTLPARPAVTESKATKRRTQKTDASHDATKSYIELLRDEVHVLLAVLGRQRNARADRRQLDHLGLAEHCVCGAWGQQTLTVREATAREKKGGKRSLLCTEQAAVCVLDVALELEQLLQALAHHLLAGHHHEVGETGSNWRNRSREKTNPPYRALHLEVGEGGLDAHSFLYTTPDTRRSRMIELKIAGQAADEGKNGRLSQAQQSAKRTQAAGKA